jgi:hypothetical protein
MLPSTLSGESMVEITAVDKFNEAQKHKNIEGKKWR